MSKCAACSFAPAMVMKDCTAPDPTRHITDQSEQRSVYADALITTTLKSHPPPVSPPQPRNSVLVWDATLRSRAESRVKLDAARIKYPLIDQGRELRGAPLSLTLHWDVMPITGALYAGHGGNYSATLPSAYCKRAGVDPSGKFATCTISN